MRKFVSWFLKAFISGLIAFCILTAFCILYYNVPVHDVTDDGATDYSWEYNTFYARATEGFAWGRTNNEGYLNTFDYAENQVTDILVMGSSHMEAYEVAMNESTAFVLGSLLPHYTVYNIGTSGHTLMICADNMTSAIDKYKPAKYVILETSNLVFTDEQLNAAIHETVPEISSHTGGIIGILQKNQFLRLLHRQLEDFKDQPKYSDKNSSRTVTEKSNADAYWESETLYNELLAKLSATVSQNGAQLIIVYQSNLRIHEDGSASTAADPALIAFFEEVCSQNNVIFLDMSEIFLREYQENHVLPHGFSNTSVGSGHLNKNGHKMIAEAVYNLIREEN